MKKLTVLLPVLLLIVSTSAYGNYYTRKARKYMRKMGLHEYEMYYTNKADLVKKYKDKDGMLHFPNNLVFNENNEEIKALYKDGNTRNVLSCFSAFSDDLNRYMNDSGGVEYIVADNTLEQEEQVFAPVFASKRPKRPGESLVIYYPAGMPFVGKYYKALAEELEVYRKQGKEVNVYFVLVRILK